MRHKAVPDWQVTIELQIAEGDLVVTTGTTRGTHQGEWFTPIGTLAPTDKHFAFTFTSTMRVARGQDLPRWSGRTGTGSSCSSS